MVKNISRPTKKFIESVDWSSIPKYWPLIVLWPTILGYIGFYTFASQVGISFEKVELPTIIGIGLYNVIAVILLYNPRSNKRKPSFGIVLLTLGYLNFLRLNPLVIVLLLVIDYQLKYVGFLYEVEDKTKIKVSFSKMRRMVERRGLVNLYFELGYVIIAIIIWLFFSAHFLTIFFVVYAIMRIIHNIKQGMKNWFMKALVISLFIPMFISVYYLNDINYTIFGLSREQAKVELKEKKAVTGTIVYKSSQFIYLQQDSANIQIPVNEVKLITKLTTERKTENGIQEIKRIYNSGKDWLEKL